MKKTLKTALALLICIVTISTTMLMASAVGKPTVKVKSVTYNTVTLYWTAVSGADFYQIQRTTDGKTWTTLSTKVTATSYTDSKSLTTGKAYGYRVRSADKGLLRTTYSSWTSMVTAKPLPAKVTGLKVNATTNTTVQLTWTKVAGATGYVVQFYSGSKWKNYKSTTGNVLNVTGLTLGKTYSFRVLAYRTVSKKNYYGPASATLKAGPTLNAPKTIALAGVSASTLKLQWSSIAGAKGYDVYNYATKTWTNAGTAKSITIKNLKAGTKYSFAVRGYSGSYKGSYKKVTFQTAPATPTGLKIIDATDTSITFGWDASTGAAGYLPSVFDYATNKWTHLATTTSRSVTVNNLKPNTKYAVKVAAYVKNSNVYKTSATAYSSWASYIRYTTVLPAPTLTAKAADSTTVKLSWTAVSGARGYMVEKFDIYQNKWLVYDFTATQWKSPDALAETSVTETTALTLSDKGASARSDLYRVRAIDSSSRKGTASKEVTGYTSNVCLNTSYKHFSLIQTLTWPVVEGASTYRVYTQYPIAGDYQDYKVSELELTPSGKFYNAVVYMAPNSIHSVMIIAYDSAGNSISSGAIPRLTFKTGDFSVLSSTNNYSVNSQLLYVARAINNTKAYTGEITVRNNSNVSYDINYLKLKPAILSVLLGGPIDGVCDTPEEVAAFFSKMDDSGDVTTSSSEVYDSTLTFNGGTAKNEEDKTVYLKNFIEPSSNGKRTAYLYNSKSYTAWKNGFENVKTTKNADGGYTVSFTIKQETGNSNYHNGFMSSFNAADFGAADGFTVNNMKIGKSTVKATIGPDGILKSYSATSPYSADFAADFTASEDSDDGSINAGDSISMEMGMKGKTVFNYTITK